MCRHAPALHAARGWAPLSRTRSCTNAPSSQEKSIYNLAPAGLANVPAQQQQQQQQQYAQQPPQYAQQQQQYAQQQQQYAQQPPQYAQQPQQGFMGGYNRAYGYAGAPPPADPLAGRYASMYSPQQHFLGFPPQQQPMQPPVQQQQQQREAAVLLEQEYVRQR